MKPTLQVCQEMEYEHTYQTWTLLFMLFTDPPSPRNLTNLIGRSQPRPRLPIDPIYYSQESLSDDSAEEDLGFALRTSQRLKETQRLLPLATEPIEYKDVCVPLVDPSEIVHDTLTFYAERVRLDQEILTLGQNHPQMCVFIAMLLREKVQIPDDKLEHWTDAYLGTFSGLFNRRSSLSTWTLE